MAKQRSIEIVEYKVQQTEFFLCQLRSLDLNIFAAQCYTDAFVSSARTVTLAMQAVISKVPGFGDWYAIQQEMLKQDRLARFFVEYRNVSTKIGDTVVGAGDMTVNPEGGHIVRHYFMPIPDLTFVPDVDVVTACEQYFTVLLRIVFNAMLKFKYVLDDRWYFTIENFREMGKSFENALSELGLPSVLVEAFASLDEADRWKMLRKNQTVGCQINDLFMRYLGVFILGPDD
ncbi:hypothetical protein JXA32_13840 [Candidatus Sumerlaeota bacterium]|nr:hypothetical protein [Candidatus Sumerlaeota bacterium]